MATLKTLLSVAGGVGLALLMPHKALAETEQSPGSRLLDLIYEVMPAIAQVESGGDADAKGDKNKKTGKYDAIGMYQLHIEYVQDVNRITRLLQVPEWEYTAADRKDPDKSRQMVKFYLFHYGSAYLLKTGEMPTVEVLARIHNGGPKGYAKKATLKYWAKIQKAMK